MHSLSSFFQRNYQTVNRSTKTKINRPRHVVAVVAARLWASNWLSIVALCWFFVVPAGRLIADEWMFPVSELGSLDLQSKGLKLASDEVFNTDAGRTCLVDGLCKVNGCTGSFVSKNGLIITNHHCAYRAIQACLLYTSPSPRDS